MNNSADILRNNSADILSFASGVGGFGAAGRHTLIDRYRGFAASPDEVAL